MDRRQFNQEKRIKHPFQKEPSKISIEKLEYKKESKLWIIVCPCGERISVKPSAITRGVHLFHCSSCGLEFFVEYDEDFREKVKKEHKK